MPHSSTKKAASAGTCCPGYPGTYPGLAFAKTSRVSRDPSFSGYDVDPNNECFLMLELAPAVASLSERPWVAEVAETSENIVGTPGEFRYSAPSIMGKNDMKKSLGSFAVLAALVIATAGCSAAIDRVIDDRVGKAIEEEKKNLPRGLDHGIQLTDLDYEPALNQITMIYMVPDRTLLAQHFDKIEAEAHKRVHDNSQLRSAMDNGVRVFHEFRSLHAGEGDTPRRFETK